ncbi:DNA-binding protein [Glaciihabitans tibetensis]|uniref:DNA-binding protein n=1 Tax=Glaciihabitans tibetensis TaxID=1266600 RepID=UPI0015E6B9AA|nr:DNA-binding protein [Glaciihabitans tibetensis]
MDSTRRGDLAGAAVAGLNARYEKHLALPVDRNAGDEIQALFATPEPTLALILELTRGGQWSVGCGIGTTRTPLPRNTREASGPAFVAARDAVDRAKRAPFRFALSVADDHLLGAADVAPLLELLLLLRARRTAEGWELFDLVATGMSQADAAARLAISPQAASQRARTAGIRSELAAMGPLVRLLGEANAAAATATTTTATTATVRPDDGPAHA